MYRPLLAVCLVLGLTALAPAAQAQVVRCESINERYRECPTPFRDRAVIQRRLSSADCREGRSWGQRRGMVWVDRGCRADFVESRGQGSSSAQRVTCSSNDNRRQTCSWNSREGRPVLVRRLSSASCVEGRSWGYRRGTIWVDQGCRAQFGTRR